MDLRIQRTRKCIQDAFVEIRKRKDIEKITVKEIAERAIINKATFYNHYESVYDLSDKLENEAIDRVIERMHPEEWETGNGTLKLAEAMKREENYFRILFSGARYGVFANKLEKRIKEEIYFNNPQYKNDPEKDVVLTIMIYGGFYTMNKYHGDEFDRAIETIAKMNDYLIKGLFETKS